MNHTSYSQSFTFEFLILLLPFFFLSILSPHYLPAPPLLLENTKSKSKSRRTCSFLNTHPPTTLHLICIPSSPSPPLFHHIIPFRIVCLAYLCRSIYVIVSLLSSFFHIVIFHPVFFFFFSAILLSRCLFISWDITARQASWRLIDMGMEMVYVSF